MKTEEMRYLIIRAASFRTLAPPSCSEGCLSQEIMTFPNKGDPQNYLFGVPIFS
jgi:hypothetical protein